MLNNAINAITNFILNKLVYDFRVRDILELLVDLSVENLNRLRFIKRKKANNVIIFINTIIKTRYNNIYKIVKLREESLVYLRFHYNYSILDINLKLFNQRVEFFKILSKISDLVYLMKLSNIINIHSIILIA